MKRSYMYMYMHKLFFCNIALGNLSTLDRQIHLTPAAHVQGNSNHRAKSKCSLV